MNTFNLTAADLSTDSLVRELECDELEHVSGAAPGTNIFTSTFQGGADGYGGSRRNP